MKRLRGPLFSLGATGRLARAYTLARRLTGPAWLLRGRPDDPKTDDQLTWRTMWQLAASLWHQLSAAEQAEWERQGTLRHMTGYAWYMSQALKPNPGIYLPLAGGNMTGIIDMQWNDITGLPPPIDPTDAARKSYVDYRVQEEAIRPGARVRRTTNQDVPTGTVTTVSFDTQDYDNDAMWEGVVNPDRLTIQTEGIYLIVGQVHWLANVGGDRQTLIWHSVDSYLAQSLAGPSTATGLVRHNAVTTWYCIVGDYIELRLYNPSVVGMQALADLNQSVVLSANRIG